MHTDTNDERTEEQPRTDGGTVSRRSALDGVPRWLLAAVPLVLLAVALGVFFLATPFAGFQAGEPLPDVTVTHTTLGEDVIFVHVTNNGPNEVTISQVLVNDAYWRFSMPGGDRTLDPLESTTLRVPYHWNPTWDVGMALVLSDGTTIHHTIVAPQQSPGFSLSVLWTLALIGVFVGVIPVALGMLWFPVLQTMSDRWLHAILAFSAGLLAFLAFDAGFEAFELADEVPGAFEGPLLVVLGIVGSLFVVQSVGAWRRGRSKTATDGGRSSGLWVAYLVAVGIGLHNLAEGLAIGSSFALGRVSLGAFLVLGFMLHNVTEGPAVVAPVARGERPALRHFLAMGLIAGAPVILGGWIGSLAFSPTVGAFFLAVGVGAIVQVVWELRGMITGSAAGTASGAATATTILAGVAGFAVMYLTDLLVVL